MRVLVTGATGFIGRGLVERLAADGHHVVAAVRAGRTAPAGGIGAVVDDLGPATDWARALEGVEAVVHLAARVHVMHERAVDPEAAFHHANALGTEALARAAVAAGVGRMLFVSSIKVNGEATPPDRGFTGDDPPAPEDAYGRSKLAGERLMTAALAGSATDGVILRPPLVHGPGVGGNLATLIRAIRRGLPLPLGAIDNRRSLIARVNLVDAIGVALSHPAVAGRIFTLADDPPISTPDLIRALAAAIGGSARLLPVPVWMLRGLGRLASRAAAIDRLTGSLVIDSRAFRIATGWIPPVTATLALRQMVGDSALSTARGRLC